MTTEPRYYIAERPECIAILDRSTLPVPPSELKYSTPGVCRFWNADHVTDYCDCGKTKGGHWEIGKDLRENAERACQWMNQYAEKHAEVKADG